MRLEGLMCLLLNDKMIMKYRIRRGEDNTSYGSSVK